MKKFNLNVLVNLNLKNLDLSKDLQHLHHQRGIPLQITIQDLDQRAQQPKEIHLPINQKKIHPQNLLNHLHKKKKKRKRRKMKRNLTFSTPLL